MADLPESIMREARAVVRSFYRAPFGQDVQLVARALRARDERAAGIAFDLSTRARAERAGETASGVGSAGAICLSIGSESAAKAIATAILSDDEGGGE